jgi:hypothetical protein
MGIVRLKIIANRRILMEKQVQIRAEIERAKTWGVKRRMGKEVIIIVKIEVMWR